MSTSYRQTRSCPPSGDRLGVKASGTVNWFLADLHGNLAAEPTSDEATVTNAIRYDPYGMNPGHRLCRPDLLPRGQTDH
jgi:hypothetical protein